MNHLRIGFALIGPAFLFPACPYVLGIAACCALMGICWLIAKVIDPGWHSGA